MEGFEFRSRTSRLFYANFFSPLMFRFSYSSWFVLFHFSVTLWDNDTFIWIYSSYTVKEKLQRKRNAYPLKKWQCVLRIASIYTFSTLFNSRFPSSRTAAGNRAYTRMTYANYSSFPGFRWRQKYCLSSFISFFGFFNTY